LEDAEKRILAPVKSTYQSEMVNIGDGSHIRSISIKPTETKSHSAIPLVLVHGFGGGIGIWIKNLDTLSRHRPIYAFDLIGFGRSSRPSFSQCPIEAEGQFVDSIEKWRAAVGLEKFILLGHSMGAYLASAYAMKFPERVEHIVLADPWGFPEQPPDAAEKFVKRVPLWARTLIKIMEPFNPLAGIRAAGPWGPGLVAKMRPDFKRKYDSLFSDDTIHNYIYHCNAQTPSYDITTVLLIHN
jgi:pimeloyl-ACP methyl ester carboxylesterase